LEYKNVFPLSEVLGSPRPGSMMLFQYSAKYKETLPFYDRNPLCYIVASQGRAFYGVNLHYTQPRNRKAILAYIDDGGDFTKLAGYNKYLRSYVQSTFLYLSGSDMEKATEMGLEDFVQTIGGRDISTSPFLPSFYK
tara:strand:- start:135 stop:545 length:411 start_codon:yes stop_codon:yes gene_type:complete